MDIFGILPGADRPMSMMEYLDNSSFDELGEIDLSHDHCRNLYHMEGKYFVPLMDSSFSAMRRFALENMIHPEDRNIYAELMEPESMERRLAESPTPGFVKCVTGCWTAHGAGRKTFSRAAKRTGLRPESSGRTYLTFRTRKTVGKGA